MRIQSIMSYSCMLVFIVVMKKLMSITSYVNKKKDALQVVDGLTVMSTECLCFRSSDHYVCNYIHGSQLDHRPTAAAVYGSTEVKALPMLIEWLVDVQQELRLSERVLYLARNYMDRYILCCEVADAQLQLLAAAAILVATKLDEDDGACTDEIAEFCDGAYSISEIISMERQLLTVLDYKTLAVTEFDFIDLYVAAVIRSTAYCYYKLFMLYSLSHYLLELSLLCTTLTDYPPSVTAVAALLLAANVLTLRIWSESLKKECRLCRHNSQLRHCMLLLHSLHSHYSQQPNTISRKYSLKCHGFVSLLPPSSTPC